MAESVKVVPRTQSGQTDSPDTGSVSVEAAMGVLAILFAILVAAWCAGLLVAQLSVSEAARAAVRVAARGDDRTVVESEAHRLVPGARVGISQDGSHIRVLVSQEVSPPGVLRGLGSFLLTASSVAAQEVST